MQTKMLNSLQALRSRLRSDIDMGRMCHSAIKASKMFQDGVISSFSTEAEMHFTFCNNSRTAREIMDLIADELAETRRLDSCSIHRALLKSIVFIMVKVLINFDPYTINKNNYCVQLESHVEHLLLIFTSEMLDKSLEVCDCVLLCQYLSLAFMNIAGTGSLSTLVDAENAVLNNGYINYAPSIVSYFDVFNKSSTTGIMPRELATTRVFHKFRAFFDLMNLYGSVRVDNLMVSRDLIPVYDGKVYEVKDGTAPGLYRKKYGGLEFRVPIHKLYYKYSLGVRQAIKKIDMGYCNLVNIDTDCILRVLIRDDCGKQSVEGILYMYQDYYTFAAIEFIVELESKRAYNIKSSLVRFDSFYGYNSYADCDDSLLDNISFMVPTFKIVESFTRSIVDIGLPDDIADIISVYAAGVPVTRFSMAISNIKSFCFEVPIAKGNISHMNQWIAMFMGITSHISCGQNLTCINGEAPFLYDSCVSSYSTRSFVYL